MRILNRFKELPFADLSLFFLLSFLFYNLFRIVEPVPGAFFYPGFLVQFCLGFCAQIYQRKMGRILTALGALSLVRLPYLSGLPIYNSMQLHGLLLGAILGIWSREVLLVLLGRNETPLPKQSDRFLVDWMIRNPTKKTTTPLWKETSFGFLVFLVILLLHSFLTTQGFGFFKGLYFQEYLFLPKLSSREAFGFSAKLLLNIGFVILYFFAEERSMPTASKESLVEHLQFGVFLGFWIQCLFLLLQSIWDLRFFSGNTFESLNVGRSPGLFLDSGSSSWILPSLGALILMYWIQTWKKTKERALFGLSIFLIILVSFLGQKQGKAFWVIWGLFLFVSGILFFTHRFDFKMKMIVRTALFLLLPFCLYGFFFGLSKIPSEHSLILLSQKIHLAFVSFFKSDVSTTLKSIDMNRAELLSITWEGIKSAPWMGNGVSSFPISLLDPSRIGTKQTFVFVDYPPNYYLALLHDLGILGSILVLFFVGVFLWERGTYIRVSLLLVPFLFGLQIQHADGAFFACFLLYFQTKGETIPTSFETFRKKIWFPILILVLGIGLSINYLVFSLSSILESGVGSEFRKQKIGVYQTSATIFPSGQNQFYEFHGKIWEWKLTDSWSGREGSINLITNDKTDLVEVIFFNSKRVQLKQELISESNNGYLYKGNAPNGANYIRIRSTSKLEFKLPRYHFDSLNQFQF